MTSLVLRKHFQNPEQKLNFFKNKVEFPSRQIIIKEIQALYFFSPFICMQTKDLQRDV